METKFVRVPFEVELAKRIVNGEVEGKVVTRCGLEAKIISFDGECSRHITVAIKPPGFETSLLYYCDATGGDGTEFENNTDLFLEIPEYVRTNDFKFKPFDKVLCKDGGEWCLCQFSHSRTTIYTDTLVYVTVGGNAYEQCIPYEGNEHLLGTTKNPE